MKKAVKKFISKLIPKGNFKEKVKLFYYNFFAAKNTSFSLVENEKQLLFKTQFDLTSMLTNEALYSIVSDFSCYQHFYKVKTGDVIIDAGANCGHLAVFFSKKVGSEGKIYAFEPDKFNIERIKKNIFLNDDLKNTIVIEELLLWNKNEYIDFCEAGTVGSSAVWMPEKELCVKKQAVTIDDWVKTNGIQKLDFIKMDIEGAEIEAMQGCVQTIKTLQPNFTIASYHVVNGEQTYIKLEEFFKSIQYPCKTVKFKGTEIITFAGPNLNT